MDQETFTRLSASQVPLTSQVQLVLFMKALQKEKLDQVQLLYSGTSFYALSLGSTGATCTGLKAQTR